MLRYYEDQHEFLPEQRNGYYGTYPGREIRGGTITSKNAHLRSHAQIPNGHSFATELTDSPISFKTCLEGILRPCFAEFFAVFVIVFISAHLDAEFSERHILNVHRISLLAVADSMAAIVFVTAFKTVHLHPAVTLAHVFSMSTSWFICCFLLIMQFLGAILAILAISATRSTGLPPYISINHDINSEWIKEAYKMMFSQFFGTALVVISHLMSHRSDRRGTVHISRLTDSPHCLFMAIALSSFLSLLQSTLHWNSLQATAISLLRTFTDNATESFHEQYTFWLGPLIASLLACFLFRLLYAPDEQRFVHCSDCITREPNTV